MKRLYTDGTIYTMTPHQPVVEAVLVSNGQIIETGTKERLQAQADEVISLHGATMYPGFVDSHSHVTRYARQLQAYHVDHYNTVEQVLEAIQAYIQQNDALDTYYVTGYTLSETLHKSQLDNLTTKPIIVYTTHQQIAYVNSEALRVAHISDDTKGAKKDAHGFTGVIVEEAVTKATKYLFHDTLSQLTTQLIETFEQMVAYGYTGAHTGDLADFHDYTVPIRAFEQATYHMPFRLHLLRHHRVFEQMIVDGVKYDDTWLEMGAMTICLDGPFTTYDAQVTQGYFDEPHMSGQQKYDDKDVERLLFLARAYHEAVAFQVNGDGAAEQAMRILRKFPAVPLKPDRFVYNTLLNEVLLKELKHLYVGFDLQLIDAAYILNERLGTVRESYIQPIGKLVEQGYVCAGGSNSRAKDLNPFLKIAKASEHIPRTEAIKLYTTNAAMFIGRSHERGMIAPGYVADFTVVDTDISTCALACIARAQAVMTIIGGQIVYNRL